MLLIILLFIIYLIIIFILAKYFFEKQNDPKDIDYQQEQDKEGESDLSFNPSESYKACQHHINQLPLKTSLVRCAKTKKILSSDPTTGLVIIPEGDIIELLCPDCKTITADGYVYDEESILATCIDGKNYNVAGRDVDITKITCPKRIRSYVTDTGKSCGGFGTLFTLGYLPEFSVCYDTTNRTILYTDHFVTNQIKEGQKSGTRPKWTGEDYFDQEHELDQSYNKINERVMINRQLGLPDSSIKYVNSSRGEFYLARGHLTPNADFINQTQQGQTFHCLNCAPQWQKFNNGNWKYLEMDIRNNAPQTSIGLRIITGTHGICSLPHEQTGKDVQLYLHVDDKNNKSIPIPELFWKIVYDPVTKAGVAVLGLNNPHQNNITNSIICKDIADELNWLTFDRTNIERGYTYACAIDDDDLRKHIPHIPELDVQMILN